MEKKLNNLEIYKLENTMPNIFNNNINKKIYKFKLIYLNKANFPDSNFVSYLPANKEWYNSIYTFNKNYIKSLPTLNKMAYKVIKNYFYLYSYKLEKKLNFKKLPIRFRKLWIKKIFLSRAELKHTNDKVIITLYIYNKQIKCIMNRIKKWNKKTFFSNKRFIRKIKAIKLQALKTIKLFNKEKNLLMLKLGNNSYKYYESKSWKKFIKKSLKKEILKLYYRHLIYLNKSKFEYTYIYKLNKLIKRIFKKNVEFNFINLKYFYLNSDILSESISLKLKKRKNKLLKIFKNTLKNINLPVIDKVRVFKDIFLYNKDRALLLKNINNINCFFSNALRDQNNKDILDQILIKIYTGSKSYLVNNILNSIKHKAVVGIRFEAKGRLSRRLTAARSLYKFRYKGSLENIYSSYQKLPSVMLRGHLKSNLQYTKINSKSRIGSFGLKGWIASH